MLSVAMHALAGMLLSLRSNNVSVMAKTLYIPELLMLYQSNNNDQSLTLISH